MTKVADSIRRGLEVAIAYARGAAAQRISCSDFHRAATRIDRLQRRNPGAPHGATAASTLILAGGTRRSPLNMP
jgi:hypothetical protein